MIKYFKKNLPDRFLTILFFLLILRLPYIIQGMPLLNSELKWMVVGEKMAHGWMIYKSIWDDLAPLSAVVYAGLHFLFGRSMLAYEILSLILVGIQAMQIQLLARKPLYAEPNMFPAYIYVIACNLFFDFYTLSPVLLSISFILIALDKCLQHLEHPLTDDKIFSIGFMMGLASLFYLPSLIVLIGICFGLLVVSQINPRQIFLVLFGFAFVSGIAFIIFFELDAKDSFYFCFINSLSFSKIKNIELSTPVIISLPLVFFMLGGMFRSVIRNQRLVNYQIRSIQFMFFLSVTCLISIHMSRYANPYQNMILLIPVSFFGAHFFVSIQKKWWAAELANIIMLTAILGMNIITFYNLTPNFKALEVSDLIVNRKNIKSEIKNKKILVLGDKISDYLENELATPYFNPYLSENHLGDMNNFVSVETLYENFLRDMPDVIIDPQRKMKPVFNRIPALKNRFEIKKGNENIYFLKNVNQK